MKHKHILFGAIVLLLLFMALLFIVGCRAGAHDQRCIDEAKIAELTQRYENEISALEMQLEMAREIEHIVETVEYVPMPVDYDVAETVDATEITLLAQMAWGEDRGIDTRPADVAAAIYTVLNRVDSDRYPGTISEVITQQGQYHGYYSTNPVDYRYYNLALDCYYRWCIKKLGVSDAGYTIPFNCYSFSGRDGANHFKLDGGAEVDVEEGVYG